MSDITNNQREVLQVADLLTKIPFKVLGDSTSGSINVTIPGASALSTKPAIATAAAPSYGEGTQQPLSTDLAGNLRVTGSISVGGTTDNAAFTAGSSTGTPAMGFYHSTIDTVTDGHAAAAGITSKRALLVNLQNASGTEIGTASTPVQVSLANTAANATAVKVDGSAVTQPVSGTVTANAGTNLNTSLLALESGGNLASIKTDVDNLNLSQGSTTSGQKGNLVLGAVTTAAPSYTTAQSNPLSLTTGGALRVDASAATVTVSGTITTTPPSNASTNIAQINGVTPLMGNGVTGTGSLRVTIASDNTAFAVNSTLSAETTKVIGTVRTADGSGNLYTSNSTTYTAKNAQDTNLLGTLGTAFSTAGKIDVKGADGDVFVRQATAANLNATVVQSGTWTVQPGNTQNTTPWLTAPSANTGAVGASFNYQSALTSTKVQIKATAANFYGCHIYSSNSAVTYIQIFNKASANVTVGSTAPDIVLVVPAGGWADEGYTIPIALGTGFTVAATTTASGSGAPTTALTANFWYI